MKTDLIKLIILIWMCVIGYLVFEIFINVKYMTDLVHAYIQMIMEHVRN